MIVLKSYFAATAGRGHTGDSLLLAMISLSHNALEVALYQNILRKQDERQNKQKWWPTVEQCLSLFQTCQNAPIKLATIQT